MSIFGGNSGGATLPQLQDEATSAAELAAALAPVAKTADLAGVGALQGETRIFNGALPSGWTETGSWPAFTATYGFSIGATRRFARRADTVYQRYSLHSYQGCIDQATGDFYYCYNQPASAVNTCTIEVVRAETGVVELFTYYASDLQQAPVFAMVCDSTYLYLIGGYASNGSTPKTTMVRIHKTTKVQTTMASLPVTGVASPAVVWDGADKLHLFGGTNYSAYQTAIRTYTISTNAWATRTSVLATAKGSCTVGLLPSGKIWVGGGYGASASNVYQIFNPANDTITAETTFASKGISLVSGASGTAVGLMCGIYYNDNWCRGGYTEETDSFVVDPNHICNEAYFSYIGGPVPISKEGHIYWCHCGIGITQAYDYGASSKQGAIFSGPLVNRYALQNKLYLIGKKD